MTKRMLAIALALALHLRAERAGRNNHSNNCCDANHKRKGFNTAGIK